MAALKEAFDALAKDRDTLQAAEEAALKAKREAERQAAKLKVETQHRSASAGTRETELQEEVDKCMVSPVYRADAQGDTLNVSECRASLSAPLASSVCATRSSPSACIVSPRQFT